MSDTVNEGVPTAPSFGEALRVWLRIGILSFGGPTAQMALMHREIVEERRSHKRGAEEISAGVTRKRGSAHPVW